MNQPTKYALASDEVPDHLQPTCAGLAGDASVPADQQPEGVGLMGDANDPSFIQRCAARAAYRAVLEERGTKTAAQAAHDAVLATPATEAQ